MKKTDLLESKSLSEYETPCMELIEISVEQGFALSEEEEEAADVEDAIWGDSY